MVIGDVIRHYDVLFYCRVNSTDIGLNPTSYLWTVTTEPGWDAPWNCPNTTDATITCHVKNTCTMNVSCTPYFGAITGLPGDIYVPVEGKMRKKKLSGSVTS